MPKEPTTPLAGGAQPGPPTGIGAPLPTGPPNREPMTIEQATAELFREIMLSTLEGAAARGGEPVYLARRAVLIANEVIQLLEPAMTVPADQTTTEGTP